MMLLPHQFSIAVLPFVNMSSDIENEYFSDGMTEEIINSLAKNESLKVTSRTSSFSYKGVKLNLLKIGAELNVALLLEGSVRKQKDNIRVSVHLHNAQDGSLCWSESYDYELSNIFKLQDKIATNVAEKIREHIGHFDIDPTKNTSDLSFDFYDIYLKSKFNFNKFHAENINLAISQIEQVIDAQPSSARYFAAKAIYYSYLGIFNATSMTEAFETSKLAADKAISLDPEDPEAHHAITVIAYIFEDDILKAQHHNALALKYRANFTEALLVNSMIALCSENYDDALYGINKAIEIDPFAPNLKYFLAVLLLRLNKFSEALKVVNEHLKIAPKNTNSYCIKGVILTRLGEYELALEHFKTVPLGDSKTVEYGPAIGIVYATMGNLTKAKEYLQLNLVDYQNLFLAYEENHQVFINIYLGNFDEAFKYIEADIKAKKNYLKFYKITPGFELLKSDPRYKILESVYVTRGKISKKSNSKKYVKSGINKERLTAIDSKLISLMLKKKPFLEPQVSLQSLADAISESANHVSQVINDQHNMNFFDFINSYRITEMIGLLNIPKNKNLTLLALAFESGFNSKTTYNAAFKKQLGVTPSKHFKSLGLV